MRETNPFRYIATTARALGSATLNMISAGGSSQIERNHPQLLLRATDPIGRGMDERFDATLKAQGCSEGLELQDVATVWSSSGQRPSASDLASLSRKDLDAWANQGLVAPPRSLH